MCLSSCITENHTLNNTRILRWSQGIFCLVSQGRSKEGFTVPSLSNQSSQNNGSAPSPSPTYWPTHWALLKDSEADESQDCIEKWTSEGPCADGFPSLLIILLFCELILRLLTHGTVGTVTQWKELGQNFLLATCCLCEHKHTSSPPVILFVKQESFWHFPCRGSPGPCGSQCKAGVNSKGLGVRWPW